jgi:hypothetical protein
MMVWFGFMVLNATLNIYMDILRYIITNNTASVSMVTSHYYCFIKCIHCKKGTIYNMIISFVLGFNSLKKLWDKRYHLEKKRKEKKT